MLDHAPADAALPATTGGLGLVMTGGGARAAYQVGVLRWLGRRYPELHVPYITGISAGAINAAHIAAHHGTFRQASEELAQLWRGLRSEHIFRVDPLTLTRNAALWLVRLGLGGFLPVPEVRAMLDTSPLRRTLEEALVTVNGELTGIRYNLELGRMRAVALSSTSYTTGQSVIWVEGEGISVWERPLRRSVRTNLTVDHVMASAALPMLFPAVRIGNAWYGDGGMRLTAPLSPALHLGATHLLTIATRFPASSEQADQPAIAGYPPPAQVFGILLNAVFLDLIDQDALRLERINRLLEGLPEDERSGMRPIKLIVIRPSQDLARLAGEYEPQLPWMFKTLARGLGTRQTASPDLLSMLMFQEDYLRRLIDLGERDAETRADELCALIDDAIVTRAAADDADEAAAPPRPA